MISHSNLFRRRLGKRTFGLDSRAHTPWGEIAHALAGKDGYARVRNSDESRIAPGAETLRELFGGEPTLILLDELSVYLRKVRRIDDARDQLTAFLTSLFKAVEGAPNAALVYTLAIGKDGRAADAYNEESQFIADNMAEAESVSARKATLLNPTEEDETVQVLRRRLFESIDETMSCAGRRGLPGAMGGQQGLARRRRHPLRDRRGLPGELSATSGGAGDPDRQDGNARQLPAGARHAASAGSHDRASVGRRSPPMRPRSTCTISIRAMSRSARRSSPASVRPPTCRRSPTMSRAAGLEKKALAQEIDAERHGGLPPYATYAARTIFLHTLAFNDPLKGLSPEQLRYSVLGPAADISFIEEARKKFIAESAYLDDRPGAPMRFLAEGQSASDHPARGTACRCERSPRRARRPYPADLRRQDLRHGVFPRWAVRCSRRGRRRPAEAGRSGL